MCYEAQADCLRTSRRICMYDTGRVSSIWTLQPFQYCFMLFYYLSRNKWDAATFLGSRVSELLLHADMLGAFPIRSPQALGRKANGF